MELIVIYAAIFGVMYFFFLRPQQQKRKNAALMQSNLSEGDEVILNSGIYGFVVAVDAQVAYVEVSDGVEIKVSRDAITGSVAPEVDADDED